MRLDEIIFKALEKDRDLRYQSAADLRADLRRLKRDTESGRLRAAATRVRGRIPSNRRWIVAAVTASLLMIVVGAFTFWLSRRHANQGKFSAMAITPFTSYPGAVAFPRFSPDGNQIAFLWDRGEAKGFDVYVKIIGEAAPLRLSSVSGDVDGVAWSPDGHRVAVLRLGSAAGVFVVSALGGPERRLAEVRFPAPGSGNDGLDWSPDGKWLAFADKNSAGESSSIFLVSPETGERRQLTKPTSLHNDGLPVFSPDGSTLAFVRTKEFLSDIYVAPVQRGEPRKVTARSAFIVGLDWFADGKQIVFAAARDAGSVSLWRTALTGDTTENLTQFGATQLSWPTVSRRGDRLAYVQDVEDTNIWEFRLTSPQRPSGAPRKLISSTRSESGAQYSPDGKRMVFTSDRSGSNQIWISDADGSNPLQLTYMKAIDTGTPHWSPDGRQIAFDSTASGILGVYVINADGGAPRSIVVDTFSNFEPSFSHDGHWIYFASDRSGGPEIWKIAASGGNPMQLTSRGGLMPLEGKDGKSLYYFCPSSAETSSTDAAGILRIPADGGESTQVIKEGIDENYWTVSGAGIYFVDNRTTGRSLKLFDFATRHITTVAPLEKPPFCCNPTLSVSPDGRAILYSQVDSFTHDIMLAENFR